MSSNLGLSASLGDIQECDKEQIHLSGAIQSHGCLMMFTGPDLRIQNASTNVKDFFRFAQDPVGARLAHLLDPEAVRLVDSVVRRFPWKTRGVNLRHESAGRNLDFYIFASEGLFGLEVEEIPVTSHQEVSYQVEMEQELKEFMFELKEEKTIEHLAQKVCQRIRRITGIDRVMMYQFIAPSWHGEVIAEDRVIESHSFMGHRFPSSDIPRPARQLYLRNQVRLISDANAPIHAIEPAINPKTQGKLDLSDSRLRSVSLIHLEYLKNMGVMGSMSFAVAVDNELWGLIACHHMTPFRLSQSKRNACEMIANAFAAVGPTLTKVTSLQARNAFELKLKHFLAGMMSEANSLTALFREHISFSNIFDATGVAYVFGDKIDAAGITPQRATLSEMAKRIREEMDRNHQDILSLSTLGDLFQDLNLSADIVCGVLAVQIPTLPGAVFMVFRPQLVKTITWGGDPQKNLDRKKFQGQINPRLSFQAWKETIRDHSKEWATYEIEGLLFLRDFIFDNLMHKQRLITELTEDLKKARSK